MNRIGSLKDRVLPADAAAAALAGRVWRPDVGGPSVVAIRNGEAFDRSQRFPTMRDLCEASNPAAELLSTEGERLGTVAELVDNANPARRNPSRPWLLAPIDLQAIKAAGVTFATSMVERVIEERSNGDPISAQTIREEVHRLIGNDLQTLVPGSDKARQLKEILVACGGWSQYLEVGIGPDAEIFTKAQPLSAVGCGHYAGVRPDSRWNNPEPEIVLIVSSTAKILGATLGNDVNLRDFEGRSALLLSKAKDNNASCSVGPFIRFFDENFGLDDIRHARLGLDVRGTDGFALSGYSLMEKISRDPVDLVEQTINQHHSYPDGLALFLGTLFAPTDDRDVAGQGFTHKSGDIVTISSPKLGTLFNEIKATDECPPWKFGVRHLMSNLSRRGLLGSADAISD